MRNVFLLVMLLAVFGCGGGGSGGGSGSGSNGTGGGGSSTSTTGTPPPLVTIDTSTGALAVSFDADGCIQQMALQRVCVKSSDIDAFAWNSNAVGFGTDSIAQAPISALDSRSGIVMIPRMLDMTDQGGLSILTKDRLSYWFNFDKVACNRAPCTKITIPGSGQYLRYGNYPGINIVKTATDMTVTWGTKAIWGFVANGKVVVTGVTGIRNSIVYFGSDRAKWTADTSLAVGLLTQNPDGTSKAVFNYVPLQGEHGNFYFVDGTTGAVVWMNLGLIGDMHCTGCSIKTVENPDQITFE